MDAVKTGTAIKLEELKLGDGGEKAYYDVCLVKPQKPPSTRSPVCSKYNGAPNPSL